MSISVLSCNKEDSARNGNSSSEEQEQGVWGYNYLIKNLNVQQNTAKYLYPKYNDENAPLYERVVPVDPSKFKWIIEYFDGPFVRFWLQNIGWLEKWRVIDVDSANPKSDGSIDAVMRTPTSNFSQRWKLIGKKSVNSGIFEDFIGVIVNADTGQMLELAAYYDDGDLVRYAVAETPYNGSKEEKYYNEHGDFAEYSTDKATTIWSVEMY